MSELENNCRYTIAWFGPCKKPADESGFCPKHNGTLCECGKQATKECPMAGSMLCGKPICDDHNYCKWHERKA